MNGRAIFIVNGTLVADPEEISMKEKTLVKFRLAWNEKRQGENHATFANFESWSDYKNKHIMQLFEKGKNVSVRGTFVGDEYQIKSKPNGDDVDVRTFRFRVEDFDLLDNRKPSGDNVEGSPDVPF